MLDLGALVTRALAGLLASALPGDGQTREERRAELLAEATSPVEDLTDLTLRHMVRGAAWLLLGCLAFPVAIALGVATRAVTGRWAGPVPFAGAFVVAFCLVLALVHFIKGSVTHYLPERWWDSSGRGWRLVLLDQLPDLIVAAVAAAVLASAVTR
ncbi:hypothetical protein AB0C02_20565 [Micromonospora sp. NPDC048999]|uniref:hypothetical protein n=1 Tax=Micromonospora sp. NPDC048999 TaxID=3155391 RepID=UPI0033F23150